MSDDVNYQENWADKNTQCKNCAFYQFKDNKHACVPEGESFQEALDKYGEVKADSHCNYFKAK